ncbi:ABC transporter permease [Sphaerisporangium aureirubrum]|uniref:ABC transporter permease n=1 Tax=Sphaerisporangium aureirubrum TaxID=1544736 RepID=A0ABW1NGV7_9ACTN
MRLALHAEWTKLRTTRGTPWLLLAVVALTAATGAAATAAVTCPPSGCSYDVPALSLAGVRLGQAAVVMLAVLVISTEYGTRMIHTTLTAMPRRTTVLTAKAILVTALTLITGTVAVLVSLLAAHLTLPHTALALPPGRSLLSLTDGPALRATLGSVLYLTLIALLSLGLATAVRDSATAIGTVLALLYVFPILLLTVSDPGWQRRLWQISPMNAGLAIQATTDLDTLPLPPWAGLGVLAAWTAASLLFGALMLNRRDA